MDSLFWQRTKIPTVLGVFVLLVLMAGLIFTTSNLGTIKNVFTSASVGSTPDGQVGVANVSDTSYTVFWTTQDEVAGAVFYGKTPALEGGVAVDERDLTTPNGKYFTHFVRVSGLEPETKYYFKIGVSDPSYGDPNNDQAPFGVVTGKTVANTSAVEPIFGKLDAQSGFGTGAIITWDAPGASKLAALSKSDGSFVLPVGTARTTSLDNHFKVEVGQVEKIVIMSDASAIATIQCVYGSDKPLPAVKVGDTLDCSNKNLALTPPPPASAPATAAHFKVPTGKKTQFATTTQPSTTGKLNIVSGQSVSTPFPTLSGKVQPKQIVKIVVHSETPYSGTVIAGPDGSWSWTPPAGLAPGEHTVTITIVNTDGTTQTITRNFTVSADNPLLPVTSGTPSASLTHFACQSNACVQVSGSGSDSCTADSDCDVPDTPPQTGATENTLLLLLIGAGFIALSTLLVIKSN